MKWLLWKVPLAIVSAVLLVVAAVVLAIALGLIERPTIDVADSAWGNVSREQTEILTTVEVANPNQFGINLDNASLGALVDLNGIRVAEGRTRRLRLPAGRSTTTVVTLVDNATIPEWWASHVQNGERTEARITPVVHSSTFGVNWAVDTLEKTREFETDVLAPASSEQPERFAVGPYSLTVKSRTFGWGDVSGETATIEGEIVLYQDSPITINAESVGFAFSMNGIPVAEGSVRGGVEVRPGVDTPVRLSAELSNARLLDWWPTHIRGGEETRYTIEASVAVETALGTARATVVGVEDRFTTALLTAFGEEVGGVGE